MTTLLESLRRENAGLIEETVEWALAGLPPDEVVGVRELLKAALDGDGAAALEALIEARNDLNGLWRSGRGKRQARGSTPISVERDLRREGDGPRPVDDAALEEAYKMFYGDSSLKEFTPEDLEHGAREMFGGSENPMTPEDLADGADKLFG